MVIKFVFLMWAIIGSLIAVDAVLQFIGYPKLPELYGRVTGWGTDHQKAEKELFVASVYWAFHYRALAERCVRDVV